MAKIYTSDTYLKDKIKDIQGDVLRTGLRQKYKGTTVEDLQIKTISLLVTEVYSSVEEYLNR